VHGWDGRERLFIDGYGGGWKIYHVMYNNGVGLGGSMSL
jgi:hypothetical protein